MVNQGPDTARKSAPKKRTGFALDKLIFALAFLVVVFVGGMAAAHFNTLPYRILNEAKAALNAQLKMEDDQFPSQIEFRDAPKGPAASTLDAEAGTEPLAVPAGSMFAHMDVCPQFGCLAWVIDRQGKVLHAWPSPDPETFFTDMTAFTGRIKPANFYIIAMAPGRDGSIVVTFHARNIYPYQVGIAKFDIDGKLLWKKFDHSHHWPTVGPDGMVYTPSMRVAAPGPLPGKGVEITCGPAKTYWEGVKVFSPDGQLVHDFDMAQAFSKGDFPGLAYSVPDGCDPFHVNGVDLVHAAAAAKLNASRGGLPQVDEGDLLVSVRESSTLAILDKETGDLKRTFTGRSAAQHSPHFLPNGDIVVFDNQGGDRATGGTRVLRLDPATGVATTVYPTLASKERMPFNVAQSGAIRPSPDGSRLLVTDNEHHALVEIDVATGKPLWRYQNIYDFKPFLEKYGFKAGEKTFVTSPQNGGFYVVPEAFTPEAYARLIQP